MINKRNEYKPNLSDLMSLCSANYMLAIKLMADKEVKGEVRDFAIGEHLAYSLSIEEVTKYTTLITIKQFDQLSETSFSSVIHPSMLIRLYHDAQMAEVISSQAVRHVKPRYDYPNKAMHQPDEKQQINQFLKEWLQLCLACGQTQVKISAC